MNTYSDFFVNKKISLPIHEQIYMQLKNQILTGEFTAGEKLPSVRQMSDLIDVNRHTISRAYDRLEEEGLVETHASSGTFVKTIQGNEKQEQTEKLIEVIENVFRQAKEMGFTSSEVAFLTYATMVKETNSKRKGLFIECNPYALGQYIIDIKNQVNLDVEGCLLDDLRTDDNASGYLDQFDVIMTTMGHYAEVKSKLKRDNIYALNFGPYLSVVNQVRELDHNSDIAIACVTKRGAQGLCDVLIDLGITNHKFHSTYIGDAEGFDEILEKADTLIVSKYALLKNREIFEKTGKRIIEYKNVLQKTSAEMLKQILTMNEGGNCGDSGNE